jgi:DNA polymerase-3 subunit beta
VKACDGETVKLAIDGGRVIVSDDSATGVSVPVLPTTDFPTAKPIEAVATFALDAATLAHDIARVRSCVSTEETRYYLNGIFFHAPAINREGARVLRMAATDGHRLARVTRELPEGAAAMPDAIVPRKAIDVIAKAMGKKPTGEAGFAFAKGRVLVTVGRWTFDSKLIDGTFPDYQRVIPSTEVSCATFSAPELAVAAGKLSKWGSTKTRAVKLSLDASGARLSTTCPESGTMAMAAACSYQPLDSDAPGSFEIGANAAYLVTLAKAFGDSDVRFAFGDAAAPMLATSESAPELAIVLMPMRVDGATATATKASARPGAVRFDPPPVCAFDVFRTAYGAAFIARDGAAMRAALDVFRASADWNRTLEHAGDKRAHDQLALTCAHARRDAINGAHDGANWTKAVERRHERERSRIRRAAKRDGRHWHSPRTRHYGVTGFASLSEGPRQAAAFAASLAAIPGYVADDPRDVIPVETTDGKRRYVMRWQLELQAEQRLTFVKSDGSYPRRIGSSRSRNAVARIIQPKTRAAAPVAEAAATPAVDQSADVAALRATVDQLAEQVASLAAALSAVQTRPEPEAPIAPVEPVATSGGAADGRDAYIATLIAERDAAIDRAEGAEARANDFERLAKYLEGAVDRADAKRSTRGRTAKRLATMRRDARARSGELEAARAELRRLEPLAVAILALQVAPPAPPARIAA